MKNYFKIPEIVFDKKDLQTLYQKNLNEWVMYGEEENISLHTKYASLDNNVISKLMSQFKNPSIIENIKFFKTLKKGEVWPHTDKRKVAMNIPIIVDDNSYTVFFKEIKNFEAPIIKIGDKIQNTTAKKYFKENCEIVETLYLNTAACINTSTPHGVINNSNEDRIILSISFKKEYDDFNVMKKLYDTRNLTRTQ